MWLFIGVVVAIIIFVWLNSDHLSHAPVDGVVPSSPKISGGISTPLSPKIFDKKFESSLSECIEQNACGTLGTHETRDCQAQCWLKALKNSPLPPVATYVDPITRKLIVSKRENFGGVYLDGVYDPLNFTPFVTTARPAQTCFYR